MPDPISAAARLSGRVKILLICVTKCSETHAQFCMVASRNGIQSRVVFGVIPSWWFRLPQTRSDLRLMVQLVGGRVSKGFVRVLGPGMLLMAIHPAIVELSTPDVYITSIIKNKVIE